MIRLEGLPPLIQLGEAACGVPERVATVDWNMWEVKQNNSEFSQYNVEGQVIATDLDRNPSALRNSLTMGSSEKIKDCFTSSDMPE